MLRWPAWKPGLNGVAIIVPPALNVSLDRNENGSDSPVAQMYGVMTTCHVPWSGTGAAERPIGVPGDRSHDRARRSMRYATLAGSDFPRRGLSDRCPDLKRSETFC